MDFSNVVTKAENLKKTLEELESLCNEDFIKGTNLNWNIIKNLLERDKNNLDTYIKYGNSRIGEMSDIKSKLKRGCD